MTTETAARTIDETSSPRPALRGCTASRWLTAGLLLPLLPLAAGCSVASRLDYAHLFSRQGWQRTDRVLETLALAPGARVADIGAGEGYWSFHLADAVGPNGRVYAVDIDAAKMRELRDEVARRGYSNIEVVHARPDDAGLAPGSIDLVFVCNAYHHIDERVAYFARLRSALAEGGRVAIVDGKSEGAARIFIPSDHAVAPDLLVAELEAAGYRHVARHDFLPLQSFDTFVTAVPAERAQADARLGHDDGQEP